MEAENIESLNPSQLVSTFEATINYIVELLKTTQSPITSEKVKNCFLQWQQSLQNFNIEQHFDDDIIKTQMQSIFIQLRDINFALRKQICQTAIEKILQIDHSEKFWWQPASFLMSLIQIKQLSDYYYDKLLETILHGNFEDIFKFFQELTHNNIIEKTSFDQKIKTIEFKGRPINDLKTLIRQIVKNRPKESEMYSKLKNNRNKFYRFSGQTLQIHTCESQLAVHGQILAVEEDKGSFKFKIETQQKEEINLIMYHNEIYIVKVTFENLNKVCLRDFLHKKIDERNPSDYQYNFSSVYLEHNEKHLGICTIIPAAQYTVSFFFEEEQQLCYLQLKSNKSTEIYEFQIHFDIDQKPEKIVYLAKNLIFSYQEFVNSYFVKTKIITSITYSTSDQNQQFIKLTQSETEGKIIDLLATIDKKKNVLVGKLLALDRQLFDALMRKIIRKMNIQLRQLLSIGVKTDIQEIATLYQQMGQSYRKLDIFVEVLIDANYASLISKQEIMSSIRTVELFTKSQNFTSHIIGKDIIAFYGNTGAGKSTAVNYFMRTPLKITKNRFGDNIVEEDQETPMKMQEEQNHCKIGQSNCISETLYSQGFKIPEERMEQYDTQFQRDIIFCDNPGFNDTRGTAYQICTNLSMDRAIEVCKSIKAIVLVIPFQILSLDRGNHLVSLLSEMEGRFPSILKPKSQVFRRFFILISKAQQNQREKYFLGERFKSYYHEYSELIRRQACDLLEAGLIKKRMQIFKALKQLCLQDRIDFIDVTDVYERDDLLLKYAIAPVKIAKNEYRQTMLDKNMIKQFSNQISVAAHSWTKLILQPYFQSLPQAARKLTSAINKLQQTEDILKRELSELDIELMNQTEELEYIEQKVKFCKEEVQRVENQKFSQQEKENIDFNFQIQMPEYFDQFNSEIIKSKAAILKEKEKIKDVQSNIQEKQKSIGKIQIQIEQTKGKLANNEKLMKKWTTGSNEEFIYLNEKKLGEEIFYCKGGSTKKERLQCMQKGQTLPESEIEGSFLIGRQKMGFGQVVKIKKDFKIIPSHQFDPNKYIMSTKFKMGKYVATIKSKGFELEGAKCDNDGKTLLLSVAYYYPITTKQCDLPFLKIVHKIPNKELFSASIKNTDSQNRELSKRVNQLFFEINIEKSKKNTLTYEIKTIHESIVLKEKHIEKMEEENQKAKDLKTKEMRAKTRKDRIEVIQKNKQNYLEQTKTLLQMAKEKIDQTNAQFEKKKIQIQELHSEKLEEERKLAECQFKRERFAFLIKTQLERNIPQTIKSFIEVAKQMCMRLLTDNKIDNQNKSATKLKLDNFTQFLQTYKKNQPDLQALRQSSKWRQSRIVDDLSVKGKKRGLHQNPQTKQEEQLDLRKKKIKMEEEFE